MIVGMTREIKSDIRNKILAMAKLDLANSLPEFKLVSNEDASELVTRLSMWPHYHLYDEIPHEWLTPMNTSEISVILTNCRYLKASHGSISRMTPELATQMFWRWGVLQSLQDFESSNDCKDILSVVFFPESKTAMWRPNNGSGYYGIGNARPEVTEIMLSDLAQKYPHMIGLSTIQRNFTLMPEAQEIAKKWRDIDRQISEVVNTYATVNIAVKNVPPLKLYLPDKVLLLLEKEPPKRLSKPKLVPTAPKVDLDLLSSQGVAHLLTDKKGDK